MFSGVRKVLSGGC